MDGRWLAGSAAFWVALTSGAGADGPRLKVEQVTSGPRHHVFGYIGHAGTIPWNRSGRYIVALQADFQDHMPGPDEAAEVILIDTRRGDAIRVVDRTRAWNFQQGTMLYWNPQAPETQFFFNDREPGTNRVFCVLFDIAAGDGGRRIKEYRFPDAPIGNSGVAQKGGSFLGLNYGRLSRLRPVTGYPGSFDWTVGVAHPADDGIFRVDVRSGERRLIVSYRRLAEALRGTHPEVDRKEIFINHTLWNRDDDRIFFYVRGDFEDEDASKRLNVPFLVDPDGGNLTIVPHFPGGHVEWGPGRLLIGTRGDRCVFYDTDRLAEAGAIGAPGLFPDPDGDKALSPDGSWLVNGFRTGGGNAYVFFRMADSTCLRSRSFPHDGWEVGPLRVDAAPCWNREGDQILFPAIADDAGRTRQLFRIRVGR